MFNVYTILLFVFGFIIFYLIKVKSKNNKPLIIYIISFLFIYILSSFILNDFLIDNYLENIEKGYLTYIELNKEKLDLFEKEEKKYYCQAADYLEGRYRAMYYVINNEEKYQNIGQGLLIQNIEDKENAYKVQVTLRYNEILRKFFLQFHTKTYNIIQVNTENVYYLN